MKVAVIYVVLGLKPHLLCLTRQLLTQEVDIVVAMRMAAQLVVGHALNSRLAFFFKLDRRKKNNTCATVFFPSLSVFAPKLFCKI